MFAKKLLVLLFTLTIATSLVSCTKMYTEEDVNNEEIILLVRNICEELKRRNVKRFVVMSNGLIAVNDHVFDLKAKTYGALKSYASNNEHALAAGSYKYVNIEQKLSTIYPNINLSEVRFIQLIKTFNEIGATTYLEHVDSSQSVGWGFKGFSSIYLGLLIKENVDETYLEAISTYDLVKRLDKDLYYVEAR